MRKRHSHKNFDVSHAAVPGEYSSIEVFDSSRNMGWSKHKSLHSSLLKHFSWCPVFFLSAPSQLKITSKEMVSVNELLSHLFDHESDRVECLRRRMMLRRHLPLKMRSSLLTFLLSVNHQQTHYPSKLESYYGPSPSLNSRVDIVLLMSSEWLQAPLDMLSAISKA